MRRPVILFLKGLFMGTFEVMPGMSGGALALVLGIYTDLVEAIKALTPRRALRLFVKPVQAFKELHLDFLVPLLLGISTSFLIASRIIPPLMAAHPGRMNALFFGLILVASYKPFSMMKTVHLREIAIMAAAALAAFWLVGLPKTQADGGLLYIFFCGAIAICAMILPGISGSYVLKALGKYEYMLEQLNSASHFNSESLVVVCVFISGIVLGITLFVRVLSWLLHHYQAETLAALTGLMLGALRAVWPFAESEPLEIERFALIALGMGIAGSLLAMNFRVKSK